MLLADYLGKMAAAKILEKGVREVQYARQYHLCFRIAQSISDGMERATVVCLNSIVNKHKPIVEIYRLMLV